MLRWNLANELIQRGQFFKNLAGVIVTRNRKIVWKQAKPAVLRTYVDNQAVLQPILSHLASKYKQTQKQSIRIVYGPIFLPIGDIFISFFSFLGQDVIKPRSNSAIIACDLSRSTN